MSASNSGRFVLVLCLSMVGCADAGAAENAASESQPAAALSAEAVARIRVKSIATPNGVGGFLGWYDTQLSMDCSFRRDWHDTTNKVRCWPTQLAGFGYNIYGPPSDYWMDSTCTKPVVSASYPTDTADMTTVHRYLQRHYIDGNYSGQLYSAKAYTGPVFRREFNSDPCVQLGPPVNGTYYEIGEEVSPSIFAEGQIKLQ
ncbi:hypothetical protein LVJ94_32875 [Pendulispora rubella]|uniref:Uncharacterized protein n=1 Tax=Pendulispora rubella TaxID=2741070 RepID=A0ABZ2KSL7_9BACT